MTTDDSAQEPDELGLAVADEFSVAVDAFRTAVSEAFASRAAEDNVVELYEAYASVFRDAVQAPAVSTLAAQRYEPYARAVVEVFASGRAKADLDGAYRSYVTAVQAAWAALDPSTLDVADLASIAEEMSWVAGVVGAVNQIAESRQ